MYAHTEGNPFFATEVLEALIERGNLFVWEGRWVRRELDRIEVPESVRETIAERTSRLGPEARETLEEASVLGQRFAFDDLRVLSDRDEEEVEEALEEAGSVGLLRDIGEAAKQPACRCSSTEPVGRRDPRRRRRPRFPHDLGTEVALRPRRNRRARRRRPGAAARRPAELLLADRLEETGSFEPAVGAARFDPGWIATASLAGLVAALELAPEWRFERAAEQTARCRELLAPLAEVVPGDATLVAFRAEDPPALVATLFDAGVVVRDLPGTGLVRVSCGWWTSDGDLDRLTAAL